MSLPRVAGTMQAGLGAARTLPMMAESYAVPQALRRTAREAGKTAPIQPEEEAPKIEPGKMRFAFARGGRIMTADRMISMAKRAKKEIESQTKALLDEPDEHIVKALKVANEHI